jgi:hypothetical protein
MKNKAGIFVLLAEIIAIVVLHSARPKSDSDKSATIQHTEANQLSSLNEQKQTVSYTSLK